MNKSPHNLTDSRPSQGPAARFGAVRELPSRIGTEYADEENYELEKEQLTEEQISISSRYE
jgi:hypothetical protein